MEYDAETAALIQKYPSLGKAIETGIEASNPSSRLKPASLIKPQSHDGREEALLQFILERPDIENIKGNPAKMLQTIDEFSATHDFLISIGGHKAKILSDLITKEKPSVVVELGGYLGYSAILFADTIRINASRELKHQVWSLEMNPEFASIAEKLIEIAGLNDLVTVIVGSAEESLRKLKEEGKLTSVDMLFLDHAEELYASDFKVCISLLTWPPLELQVFGPQAFRLVHFLLLTSYV
jgi:catechol O-methyltransferase